MNDQEGQNLIFNRPNFFAGGVGALVMGFTMLFLMVPALSMNFLLATFIVGFSCFGVLGWRFKNTHKFWLMAFLGGFGSLFSMYFILHLASQFSFCIFFVPTFAAAIAALTFWDWRKWLFFSFMALAVTFGDCAFIAGLAIIMIQLVGIYFVSIFSLFILYTSAGFIFCFCMNMVMQSLYKKASKLE